MMKTSFKILLLLMSTFATTALAQVNKIPSDTRLYLQLVEASNKSNAVKFRNSQEAGQKEAKLFVSCAPDADAKAIAAQIKALGAKPQGVIGRYIMVSTPVGLVEQIAAIEGVTYISKSPSVNLNTVISKEVTGAAKAHAGSDGLPQAFTGKGVVVGVIDAGFDLEHPAFKDSEGNLRIKAYYAPELPLPDGASPIVTQDGTTLAGRDFTTSEAILGKKYDTKVASHGSHCASTAAGSTFDWAGGMSPDADLVLCSLADSGEDEDDFEITGESTEGVSYSLMQSILYICDYAKRAGKPCIISMSLNSQEGPHDGSSFISSMLNQMALDNTNMAMAVGNEGGYKCYIGHTFADNDTLHSMVQGKLSAFAYTRAPGEMAFQIGIYDKENKKEVWRSELLSSADGGCSFILGFGDYYAGVTNTDQHEDIKNHMNNIMTGVMNFSIGKLEDGRAKLFLRVMGNPKDYNMTFHITSAENSVVDVWGDDGEYLAEEGSDYYTAGSNSVSMGDWSTGGNIISVGSWVSKTSYTNIKGETASASALKIGDGVGSFSPFSSHGTDVAGNSYPYVSAPGTLIISAVNRNDILSYSEPETNDDVVVKDENGFIWGAMSGTSMATPTVAGIIALWLEANPDLTYEEIKETIAATSNTDEFTEANPIRFGHGKINAYKGLLHVLGLTTSVPELSQNQPEGVTFRLVGDCLYIDGAEDGTAIRIYATNGQFISSAKLANGSINLPSGLPTGVYAVQVGKLGSTLIRK